MREQAGSNRFHDYAAAAVMTPAKVSAGTVSGEVWVVDDDQSIRWVLARALGREGLAVRTFTQAAEVLAALDESTPVVLVSDIRMPGASGIELLYQVRQRRPDLPVIIMTAYSDLDSAVSTFQAGAFEYLPKPFDLVEAVALIKRAAQSGPQADSEPAASPLADSGILGQAAAMQAVFRAIGRLSQSSATVLITGESGSGKELVARALHRHGTRAKKPFIALNMAAIPRDLLESELFGYERGAFTGAQQSRSGRFEQADGGTLFLDEIGDMPAEMQTRLLRVLSEGWYYRVGGSQPIHSDVRVIAATHQDLEARVRAGLFREDLLHRINVIRLRLPPLRERAEDVPLLAAHFLGKSAATLGTEPKRLTAEAAEVLAGLPWPGNVRQLENVCHWLTVMAPGPVVTVEDLPPELLQRMPAPGGSAAPQPPAPAAQPVAAPADSPAVAPPQGSRMGADTAEALQPGRWAGLLGEEVRRVLADSEDTGLMQRFGEDLERVLIREALRASGGHRIEAARRLGIGRNTISRRIRELGMDA